MLEGVDVRLGERELPEGAVVIDARYEGDCDGLGGRRLRGRPGVARASPPAVGRPPARLSSVEAQLSRSCELARAVGTRVIGGGFSGDPAELAPVLQEHEVLLAIENHPEKTPVEVLAKIEAGGGTMAATVDPGWWGSQRYDAAQAIEELGEHVAHVHLKDVLRTGQPHDTWPWGAGVVDAEACVRMLERIDYRGALAVEHEPEDHDPGDEIRSMREQLETWLL
jgi:L-ribulose-5-phosphate 3-epimerase